MCASKPDLSGARDEKSVKTGGQPSLSLRVVGVDLIDPPLRAIRASGQSAADNLFYFPEPKLNFLKSLLDKVVSKGIII